VSAGRTRRAVRHKYLGPKTSGHECNDEVRKALCSATLPIMFRFPAVVPSIPPLMVQAPATLALGIQISTAVIGLTTMIAVVMNGFIQFCFGLLDRMLALRPIVCMKDGRGHEQQKRHCYESSHYLFAKSSIQSVSPFKSSRISDRGIVSALAGRFDTENPLLSG